MECWVEKYFFSSQKQHTYCFGKIYRYKRCGIIVLSNINKNTRKNYENGCFLKPHLLTDRKRPDISVTFCQFLPVWNVFLVRSKRTDSNSVMCRPDFRWIQLSSKISEVNWSHLEVGLTSDYLSAFTPLIFLLSFSTKRLWNGAEPLGVPNPQFFPCFPCSFSRHPF